MNIDKKNQAYIQITDGRTRTKAYVKGLVSHDITAISGLTFMGKSVTAAYQTKKLIGRDELKVHIDKARIYDRTRRLNVNEITSKSGKWPIFDFSQEKEESIRDPQSDQ